MKQLYPSAKELRQESRPLRQHLLHVATYPQKPENYPYQLSDGDLKYEVDSELLWSKNRLLDHAAMYVKLTMPARECFWQIQPHERRGLLAFNDIVAGPVSAWKAAFEQTYPTAFNQTYILGHILLEELRHAWPWIFGKQTCSDFQLSTNKGVFKHLTPENFIENCIRNERQPEYRGLLFRTVHLTTDIFTAWLLEDFLRAWDDVYLLRQTETKTGYSELWHREEAIMTPSNWIKNSKHPEQAEENLKAALKQRSFEDCLPTQPLSTCISLVITTTDSNWSAIIKAADDSFSRHMGPYLIRTMDAVKQTLMPI